MSGTPSQDGKRDPFKVNGKLALLMAIASLGVGGGGTWYATSGEHRYTQAEADRDVAVMEARLAALEREIQIIAIQGPIEVRRVLERLEVKLDRVSRAVRYEADP